MRLLGILSFLAVSVLFCGCGQEVKEEKQKVHEINFGALDVHQVENPNEINKGRRFIRYLKINLNTDSIFLKINQYKYYNDEHHVKDAKYYTAKVQKSSKDTIQNFLNLNKKPQSGFLFNRWQESDPTVLDCRRVWFFEYRQGPNRLYYFLKEGDGSNAMYDLGSYLIRLINRPNLFSVSKRKFLQNDDSLIHPIFRIKEVNDFLPPPAVEQTIKFTPPVEKKNP